MSNFTPFSTPFTSPSSIPNSGSKKFSGQLAAIYKINFFRLQNEIEYDEYKNSLVYNNPTPYVAAATGSKFPNQEPIPPGYFIPRRFI